MEHYPHQVGRTLCRMSDFIIAGSGEDFDRATLKLKGENLSWFRQQGSGQVTIPKRHDESRKHVHATELLTT